MVKSVLSSEEIQDMKTIAFKIVFEDAVMEDVALVKNEFQNMDDTELFDTVFELTFCNYEYHAMNEVDKFDYLVDEILIKQGLMQRS